MTKGNKSDCLIFFVKAPVAGKVKTRLAETIGADQARDIYRCFVEDMLITLSRLDTHVMIYYSGDDTAEVKSTWQTNNYTCRKQSGAGLGNKMKNAFTQVFQAGFQRAILIGSDIPDLPYDYILSSFESLISYDAVIGPATDGGYFLIGFSNDSYLPDVFDDITWSSDKVLIETLQVLESKSINTHLLDLWSDIDCQDDLDKLCQRSMGTEFENSKTMSLINRMYPKGIL